MENTTLKNGDKPIRNPYVMLREEFDDWAVLFDPDTGRGFGLSPTGVYLWKLLDGKHSLEDMVNALHQDAGDVPEEAREHLIAFVGEMSRHGLTAYEPERVQEYRRIQVLRPSLESRDVSDPEHFTYRAPQLVNLNSQGFATGEPCCSPSGTSPNHNCTEGTCAGCSGCSCSTGYSPSDCYGMGANALSNCSDGNIFSGNSCGGGYGAGLFCDPTGSSGPGGCADCSNVGSGAGNWCNPMGSGH